MGRRKLVVEVEITPVVEHEADAVAVNIVSEVFACALVAGPSQSAITVKQDALACGDGDAVGVIEIADADAVEISEVVHVGRIH